MIIIEQPTFYINSNNQLHKKHKQNLSPNEIVLYYKDAKYSQK